MAMVPGVKVMEFAYTLRAISDTWVLGTVNTLGLMPLDGTRMRNTTSALDFATCQANQGR